MSESESAHGWTRAANDAVWHHTRTLFLGSLLVFLITITLGFWNVVTPGDIPRWQFLTHFHSATIGWITLSAIGFTVWVFTGTREVSESYERRVGWLAWAAVLLAAGYVVSFGIGFSLTGNAFTLLPIFGTGMMLVFWSTALLAWTQLRQQPVVRTVHLLMAGAFLVASLGAIMGVLLGLQHAIGSLPLPAGIPAVSNHGGPMDAYAAIMGTALVEWLVDRDDVTARSWHGILQAGLLTIWGVTGFIPIGAVSGIGKLVGLLGVVIFLGRIGWRAVAANPFRFDERAWATFAPLWFLVFLGGILGFSSGVIPLSGDRVGPVVFHANFVGFLTNALFGMLSGRTRDGPTLHEYAEPAAFWLINIGLVAFAATEIIYGGRHGAVVMGLGVLLAVATMLYRLLKDSTASDSTSVIQGVEGG